MVMRINKLLKGGSFIVVVVVVVRAFRISFLVNQDGHIEQCATINGENC